MGNKIALAVPKQNLSSVMLREEIDTLLIGLEI